MNCRICGNKTTYLYTLQAPIGNGGQVFEQPYTEHGAALPIYRCENCSHLQAKDVLPLSFYKEHNNPQEGIAQHIGDLSPFNKKAQKLKKFTSPHLTSPHLTSPHLTSPHLTSKNYFEIGCGNGIFLKLMTHHFSHCTAFEPSASYYVAKRICGTTANLTLYHDYFSEERCPEDQSAFAALEVFEHLSDPLSTLRAAYKKLRPGGVGLINVPNGDRIFQQGLYHQIILQHLNYFTANSLIKLATLAGFEILELKNLDAAIEWDLYIRKPTPFVSLKNTHASHLHSLCSLAKGGRTIALWGGGAKSSHYLPLARTAIEGFDEKLLYIFDGNPEKQGKYIANLTIPIDLPSEEKLAACDLLLIFATAYKDEILHSLEATYHWHGKVIFFDGNLIIEKKL